jgi:hypothetical protein
MSAEKKSQPVASPPAGDLSDLTHALTLRLDGPIPVAWQSWREIHVGPTLIDLLETMATEASRASFWPQSEIAIAEAKTAQEETPLLGRDGDLNDSRLQQAAQERNQALRLGYALAMTRGCAPMGPETWYKAALDYAAITLMSEAEFRAVYHHLNALYEAEAERHGWI